MKHIERVIKEDFILTLGNNQKNYHFSEHLDNESYKTRIEPHDFLKKTFPQM